MPKLILFFTLIILPFLLFAQRKHDTILVGKSGTGSFFFANEFAKRWNALHTVAFLSQVEPLAHRRLQRLVNGQGTLAVIGAKEAFEMLSKYPTLSVVSPLWKNRLYVLGHSNQTLQSFNGIVYFHQNASDFLQTKVRFLQSASNQVAWKPLKASSLFKTLDNLNPKEILVFYAPSGVFKNYPNLKQIKMNTSTLEFYQKQAPWLLQEMFPAKTQLEKSRSVLVQYPLLIARRDAKAKQVTQILKLLHQEDMLKQLPLLQNVSSEIYQKLSSQYDFHTAAKGLFSNWLKSKS